MKLDLFGYTIEIHKNGKCVTSTEKQKAAAAKATAIRQKRTKEKIVNAINLLKLENKNISEYAIAKYSGCSINTIKKYRKLIQKLKQTV